ncbi:unnamed protein product [Ectocarpus sp. 4 AP-2014]
MSRHRQQMPQTSIVVGGADQFGALVVSNAKHFVKRHPVISASWVVGLLVSTLASGYTPSTTAVQNYENKMIGLDDESVMRAHGEMVYWNDIYRRSKGMFWTCDEQCTANRKEFERRQKIYLDLNKIYLKGEADAKSELGIFSEDGVEETRDLFWRKVSGGKQFAKRATMLDVMFVGIDTASRRDEGLATIVARIAFRFVVNLTMGLFMAVFQFLFSMWTVIWSYQPDPLSTLAFAAMAALGAVSMLATWLLGLAAVGVTGVYTVAKLAETAQIEAARQQGQDPRRGQYVQQQQQQQQQQQGQYRQQQFNQQQQQPRRRPAATAPPQPAMSSTWSNID